MRSVGLSASVEVDLQMARIGVQNKLERGEEGLKPWTLANSLWHLDYESE